MVGLDSKGRIYYNMINTYTRITSIAEDDGIIHDYHIYAKFHDGEFSEDYKPAHVRHIKDIKSEYPNLF